jgi:hypothetical protein
MLENISYAQLYSEIFPDYINSDTIISIPSQRLNQHFINTEIKGTLIGIQKIKKLSFKFYPFINDDFISIPCSDMQFAFYVQFPINIMQTLTVRISPSTKESILFQKNEEIGSISALDISLIDNEYDLPDIENFYLRPNTNIDFKLANQRESADSDIYRFFINGIEVLTLSNSTTNAYLYNDFSSVLPLFTLNKNNVENSYDKDYCKYLQKNSKNKIIPPTIIDSSVCKGVYEENDTQHFVVEKIEDYNPVGIYFDVQYQTADCENHNISVEKFLNRSINTDDFFVNKEIIVTQGKSIHNRNTYNVLIASEKIIAYNIV